MLFKFRRHPRLVLEKETPSLIRKPVVAVYNAVDRNGWLSDLIADPQSMYEDRLIYKKFRRKAPSTPRVSVIIATHNDRSTLRQSVASILNQSVSNVEVVIVDDCSTDGAAELIADLASKHDQIRVITNERRLGTGPSRNAGMLAASGDYVTFQDGDDTSSPYRLEHQLLALTTNPSKKLATCNYVRVDERGRRLEINDKRVMKCIISMMFPREEVLNKVGFFIGENVSEDADFYERIKIAFGPSCEAHVFRTLYFALFREVSSFFTSCESIAVQDRRVIFTRSQQALAEWDALRKRHEDMRMGLLSPYHNPAISA